MSSYQNEVMYYDSIAADDSFAAASEKQPWANDVSFDILRGS